MDWRFSTFLLTLFGLLIAFTWATSDPGLCGSGYVKGVLADHTKDGALNCFDFWLNRYQTLIAAFITLITAAVAAYLVWAQLVANRTQASAAMLSTIIDRYQFWGDYLDAIKPVYEDLIELPRMMRAVDNAGTTTANFGMKRAQKGGVLLRSMGDMLHTVESVKISVRKLRIRESDRIAILSAIIRYENFAAEAVDDLRKSRSNDTEERENLERIGAELAEIIALVDGAVEILRIEVAQAQKGIEESRLPPSLF